MLICLNGRFISAEEATLPIADGGFLYGDTLFETLKARGQDILLSKAHLDRLELSAKLLHFPCDRKRIETALQQLAEQRQMPFAILDFPLAKAEAAVFFGRSRDGRGSDFVVTPSAGLLRIPQVLSAQENLASFSRPTKWPRSFAPS